MIIGVAMGNVVNSLVNDVLMPPSGYALGNLEISPLKVILKETGDPATEVAIRFGSAPAEATTCRACASSI